MCTNLAIERGPHIVLMDILDEPDTGAVCTCLFCCILAYFFFGMNNSRRLGIYFGHKTFHSSASVGKMVDPAAKNMGIQRFCPFWQREGFDSTGFFVGLDSKPRSETGEQWPKMGHLPAALLAGQRRSWKRGTTRSPIV